MAEARLEWLIHSPAHQDNFLSQDTWFIVVWIDQLSHRLVRISECDFSSVRIF
jgi:hypothetical protein